MSGKFITTTLILAVLSNNKNTKQNDVKEVVAATENHAIIWSKNCTIKNMVPTERDAEPVY